MTKKSFEQINQELNLKLNPQLEIKIINTLQRLPQDIYEYVLENVQFEEAMDCCLSTPEIKKSFLQDILVIFLLLAKNHTIIKAKH